MVDVQATDAKKKQLDIKRVDGPTFDIQELQNRNQTDYLWSTIDVTDGVKKAIKKNEASIIITVEEYFKRRRMPFPKRITIKDQ